MTQDDEMLQALSRLPLIQPEAEWENRIRARCHAAISRRASRHVRRGKNLSNTGLISVLAVTGLCVYLVAMLAQAARLAGLVL